MLITRKSMVSGKEHTLDLPISAAEALAYEKGALIQDAFPNLSPDQREFIKSGITAEEWTSVFGSDDDDMGKLQAGAPSLEDGKR